MGINVKLYGFTQLGLFGSTLHEGGPGGWLPPPGLGGLGNPGGMIVPEIPAEPGSTVEAAVGGRVLHGKTGMLFVVVK